MSNTWCCRQQHCSSAAAVAAKLAGSSVALVFFTGSLAAGVTVTAAGGASQHHLIVGAKMHCSNGGLAHSKIFWGNFSERGRKGSGRGRHARKPHLVQRCTISVTHLTFAGGLATSRPAHWEGDAVPKFFLYALIALWLGYVDTLQKWNTALCREQKGCKKFC